MHFSTVLFPFLPLVAQCINVVLSNDDGWAEINVRSFYDALNAANYSVVLSAPADNKSGTGTVLGENVFAISAKGVHQTGSSDSPATPRTTPCHFNSCPSGSPAQGSDASNPRLNYVNSFPVTSMRYGIQTLSPRFFGTAPDIAVAGFNVGANLGTTVLISGTVGAATEAAKEGIPAIAFSGTSGSQTAYTATPGSYVKVYTELSTNVTQTLVDSAKPYLPSNIWLNVNFPTVSSSTCASSDQFKFVLSRINSASLGTAADLRTCGSRRLPTESKVVGTAGCYASISVGVATSKADASAAQQKIVQQKLARILSCLPA